MPYSEAFRRVMERVANGQSLRSLSVRTGLHRSTIHDMVQGQPPRSYWKLVEFADRMELPLDLREELIVAAGHQSVARARDQDPSAPHAPAGGVSTRPDLALQDEIAAAHPEWVEIARIAAHEAIDQAVRKAADVAARRAVSAATDAAYHELRAAQHRVADALQAYFDEYGEYLKWCMAESRAPLSPALGTWFRLLFVPGGLGLPDGDALRRMILDDLTELRTQASPRTHAAQVRAAGGTLKPGKLTYGPWDGEPSGEESHD